MSQPEITVDLRQLTEIGLDFSQYFGLWAVEESRFLQMLERVSKMDLVAHVQAHAGDGAEISAAAVSREQTDPDQITIARVELTGTLTKRGSSMSAGSLVRTRQAIRAAAKDPEVDGILLVIDSPGGTVAGTGDLAAEVAAAVEKKPVYAFAEDLAASAAYWVGSQATKLFANHPTATIGSIGTFIGLYDYSGYAAKEGVKAVVIKSGKYKGTGFAGTEITDEQKQYFQAIVDKTQAEFSAGISAGRKLPIEKVNELADGRVHMASDAIAMGLIDGVQSYEATLAGLRGEILARRARTTPNTSRKRGTTMAEETTTSTPATASYADLKAHLVGADAAFICAQMEKNATLAQAQSAWMAEQAKRLEAAQKEASEAKAAAEAAKKTPGVDALGSGGKSAGSEGSGDAIAEWNEALTAKEAVMKNRGRAIAALVREQPELHQRCIAAYNASVRARQ